jgi:hypothetical protein
MRKEGRLRRAIMHWISAGLLVCVLARCSDDDEPGPIDAGPDGSAGRGASGRGSSGRDGGGVAGTSGAGRDASAGRDANAGSDAAAGRDASAGSDAGDPCAAFPLEDMPLWYGGEVHFSARRMPLDVLCTGACNRPLDEFEAGLRCDSPAEDAGDEGEGDAGDFPWLRSEGCGTVQFTTGPHPLLYNFDADTGKLIGHAQLDDAPSTTRGSGECESAGWIAGTVRARCDDEKRSVCSLQ